MLTTRFRYCQFLAAWLLVASPAAAQQQASEDTAATTAVGRQPAFLEAGPNTDDAIVGRSRYFSDHAAAHDDFEDAAFELPEIPAFDELPSDELNGERSPHRLASESWCVDESVDDDAAACFKPFVRSRTGCYQGSQLNAAWLGDNAASDVTVRTLDTSASFGVPLGRMDNLLVFTPFFRADTLDAPVLFDLPDTLYETGVKSLWKRTINDRWSSLLAFTPSVRSDFSTSDGAFRLFGLGLMTYQWIPGRLAVSGGAMYTGRDDFPVLPSAGLLWTPTADWKLDLQFPSPRISRCISRDADVSESWLYLAGVFGGNTWSVTRSSGLTDDLTLRDLRLVGGIEYLLTENRGVFAEVGFVFNRSLEYTRVPIERELDATWMIRAGLSF